MRRFDPAIASNSSRKASAICARSLSSSSRSVSKPHLAEDESVLLIQRLAKLFRLAPNQRVHFRLPSHQVAELLDQLLDIQAMDVLAVLRQAHVAHQRDALVMECDGDHRFAEDESQQDVVKASGDYDVGCG